MQLHSIFQRTAKTIILNNCTIYHAKSILAPTYIFFYSLRVKMRLLYFSSRSQTFIYWRNRLSKLKPTIPERQYLHKTYNFEIYNDSYITYFTSSILLCNNFIKFQNLNLLHKIPLRIVITYIVLCINEIGTKIVECFYK